MEKYENPKDATKIQMQVIKALKFTVQLQISAPSVLFSGGYFWFMAV